MARKIPEILTKKEISTLLSNINRRYFSNYKNEVIIRTFLGTGLRCSELCNLKWKHVKLDLGSIFVDQGKGNQDRKVWFNENLLELLRNYKIKLFDTIQSEDEIIYVFPTRANKKMQTSHVRRMTQRISLKKIGRSVNPHLLRHTYASYLYKNTSNLRMVQKSLGHKNIQTTQIYTHIFDNDLEKAHKSFDITQ